MSSFPRLTRFAFIFLALHAATVEAQALSIEEIGKLDLMVEDPPQPDGMQLMGPVKVYFQSLQKVGHGCELSTYEYGGLIDCRTSAGKRVLIDLVAEPTLAPEFARATVRPDGVNSKELAGSEAASLLTSLVDPS